MSSPGRQTALLALVLGSYLVIALDVSIAIAALPEIGAEMGFSSADLSWVQNAYTLPFGGLLLLGARAGDLLGRRRVFVLGIAVFTVASLAVGAVRSPAGLIAARALQGAGAAVLAPAGLALLQSSFPAPAERARAVAYYGAVAGIAASLGLVLGGLLTEFASWRVAFFINVPIGIAMALAAARVVPETPTCTGQLDLAGALSSTLGMTALVFGCVHAAGHGWTGAATLAPLGSGAALLALFLIIERRARQPIAPLHLFASRERAGAYAARALFVASMMGFWFFVTQYLQAVRGLSPPEAGVAFLPLTVVNFGIAVANPALTRRLGSNAALLSAGLALTLVGMAWLSRLGADTPYLAGIALPMVLIGIGQGASLGPLTAAGIADVRPNDAGAASGLVNVAHQLGGSLGLALLVTLAVQVDATPHGELGLSVASTQSALRGCAVMVAAALALMGALPLTIRRSNQLEHNTGQAGQEP